MHITLCATHGQHQLGMCPTNTMEELCASICTVGMGRVAEYLQNYLPILPKSCPALEVVTIIVHTYPILMTPKDSPPLYQI